MIRKQQGWIRGLQKAVGHLWFSVSVILTHRKGTGKGLWIRKNLEDGDRNEAKLICAIHNRHCGNEHEVKRMLEREANERHRNLGVCSPSNIQKGFLQQARSFLQPSPTSLFLSAFCHLSVSLSLPISCTVQRGDQKASGQEQVGTERKQRVK